MKDGCTEDEQGYISLNGSLWDNRKPPPLMGVTMTLEGSDLWRKFHELCTEMIITKTGRNMFPVLTVSVAGLEPDARYYIVMEICSSSEVRYKFVGSNWKAAGKAEEQFPGKTRVYIHQDSPATGAHWMREPIKMKNAKLTNNPMNNSGHIILSSMHKYIPHIHVVKTSDIMNLHWSPTATFKFPETEFIAVTAYQNEQVTRLKINNNPFAKGFRENGLSNIKRKQTESTLSRKRHCSDRTSFSSVESTQSVSPPADDCEESEHKLRCDSTTCDHNENITASSADLPCDELSTAVTNININTNTIQYPYSGMYFPFYHSHHHEQQFWKFPFLFPPPPPLLSHCFLPYPYHSPFFFNHPHQQFYHFSQSSFSDLSLQPYDYSLRDKSA